MTQEKEESLQVSVVQLGAEPGTLPYVQIPEDTEAEGHELGPRNDSVSEETQPLVSDNEISSQISSQTDPDSHEDERHVTGTCVYDTKIVHDPKLKPDPNAHLYGHREGFLDRSAIIGPLNILACAATPSTTADDQYFCKRITDMQKQQNIAFFSELQGKNVTTGKSRQELTLDKGDILQVLESRGDWWKVKNYKGEVGHAPYIMLQIVYGPGIKRKPKPYFSRRKHVLVIVLSMAIIVFIVVIGVMQIKRPRNV